MKIPAVLLSAPRIPLPDFSGFLAMPPLDGECVTCPTCAEPHALAFVVIRQLMPTGEWAYSCLTCAGTREEVAV